MTPPAQRPSAFSRRTFWWAALALSPPLALAFAAAGFGIDVDAGGRLAALASLTLWSVAEEIVFRGAVQGALLRAPALRERRFGISGANAIASLPFAALHLWRHAAVVAVGVYPVSLVLGYAREASGRVWPAALLHLGFNLLLCAATLLVAAWR